MTADTTPVLSDHVLSDHVYLNTQYLYGLQRLAQDNTAEAAIRYGVSRNVAEQIRDMTLAELDRLANQSITLFRLNIEDITAPDVEGLIRSAPEQKNHKT